MKISFYGKSGVGRTTLVNHIAIQLKKNGHNVLVIGLDPKRDTSLEEFGEFIPTIQEFQEKKTKQFTYTSEHGVDYIEAGPPPAAIGCGGFVTGEVVKILEDYNLWAKYDYCLFDAPGELMCGGYAAPLQYSDVSFVVGEEDYSSVYSINRFLEGVIEKSQGYNFKIGGIIIKNDNGDIINKYTKQSNMKVAGHLYDSEFYNEEIRGEGIKNIVSKIENNQFSEVKEIKPLIFDDLKLLYSPKREVIN